jgi:sulfite reductase alpha subunit-like flavoprotein
MLRWLAAAALCLALPAAAQPAANSFDALRASAEITNDVSKGDIAAAAAAASRLMEGPSAEKLKSVFRVVSDLGQGQYTDLEQTPKRLNRCLTRRGAA